jgi:hypothetical protein
VIDLVWFLSGVFIGVIGTIVCITYIGHKEIKKRGKRSSEWQKIKKKMDSDFHDEYGV